jgi:hypothetical protein
MPYSRAVLRRRPTRVTGNRPRTTWSPNRRQLELTSSEKMETKPFGSSGLHRVSERVRAAAIVALLALSCIMAAPSYADDATSSNGPPAAVGVAPTTTAPSVDPHAAQNPIANVISIPFQNNTYFDVGPLRQTENILLVQPVVPVSINNDWTLVTRWVTPIISAPRVSEATGPETGLGNIEPQFYFTPTHPGPVIWGIGPEAYLPTATDKRFGVDKWGGGLAAVALTIQGHWLFGVLANNVWAGTGKEKVNELTLQPFVFYNLPKGWYLVSSTVTTANWEAAPREQWTVPVGGGFGRVFKIGKQAINARFEVTDNVQRPVGGPTWATQFQIQLLY